MTSLVSSASVERSTAFWNFSAAADEVRLVLLVQLQRHLVLLARLVVATLREVQRREVRPRRGVVWVLAHSRLKGGDLVVHGAGAIAAALLVDVVVDGEGGDGEHEQRRGPDHEAVQDASPVRRYSLL